MIISTPEHWDMLSRRWKHQRHIQEVSLFIIDELHLIGQDIGVLVVCCLFGDICWCLRLWLFVVVDCCDCCLNGHNDDIILVHQVLITLISGCGFSVQTI